MGFNPDNSYQGGPSTGTSTLGGPKFPGTGQPAAGVNRQWWYANVVTDTAAHNAERHFTTADVADRNAVPIAKTVGQMLLEFDASTASAAEVDTLQALLWNGGFYGSSKTPTFTPGAKDSATRAAFARALEEASRGQAPFAQFLDERATTRAASGVATARTSPTFAQLTDPASLEQDLDKAVTEVLGQEATPAQKAAFIAGVHHAETARAGTIDSAGGGVVPVVDVNPQARAVDFARKIDPTKADARKVVAAAGVVQQMLTGGR